MKTNHHYWVRALLCAAFLFAAALVAKAGILTGPVTNPGNGHIYYLLTVTNWTAAEQQAEALGGHLATIRNATEENWVYTNFNYYSNVVRALWIGLYDPNPNVNSTNRATRRTEFVWISGEPVTYSHWSPVEPNNPSSTEGDNPPGWEYYVHIWERDDLNAGTWNNYHDNPKIFGYLLNGVVEIIPTTPPLWINPTSTNQVAILWPSWATNYGFQSTPTLNPPAWKTMTNRPSTNGNIISVTNTVSNATAFYRLIQQ